MDEFVFVIDISFLALDKLAYYIMSFCCSNVKAEEVIEEFVLSFGIVTPRQGLLTIKHIITACYK
ncbi:hypothetical protein D3C73_1576160 [compost metagenome]